jgi:hypothetical protein
MCYKSLTSLMRIFYTYRLNWLRPNYAQNFVIENAIKILFDHVELGFF